MSKPRPTPIVCASCGMSNASTAIRCARCNSEFNDKTHHGESDVFLRSWIGDYFVSHLIGEGALGRVYQATHRATKQIIAIKILTAGASKEKEHVERFLKEAQIMSQLRHPNLVEVYESGILTGNRPYLMMEYLQGNTLGQQIGERKLFTSVEAASLFIPLCQALDLAHQRGIVHRDLKPDNIFLALQDKRLVMKILDFGVAKLIEQGPRTTHSGMLIGTPRYMSPEQAESPQDVDGRSDIYSVGAILYELVTGKVPFEAESTVALLFKHHDEPPPQPSSLVPSVSQRMNRLILRCLAKSPENRPARALFVAQELQQILVEETRFASEEVQAFVRETNPGIELNFENTGELEPYEPDDERERSTTEPIEISASDSAEIQKMSQQLGIAPAPQPLPSVPSSNAQRVAIPKPTVPVAKLPPPPSTNVSRVSLPNVKSSQAPATLVTPSKQPAVSKPPVVPVREPAPVPETPAELATNINIITLQEVPVVTAEMAMPPLPKVHQASARESQPPPQALLSTPPPPPSKPSPPEPMVAVTAEPPPMQSNAATAPSLPEPPPVPSKPAVVEAPEVPAPTPAVPSSQAKPASLLVAQPPEEEEEEEAISWNNEKESTEDEIEPSPSMVKLLDPSTRSKLWFNETSSKLRSNGLIWLLFVVCLGTLGFGMWWVLKKEEKSSKVFAAVKLPESTPTVAPTPPPTLPEDMLSLQLRLEPADAKLILWVNQVPREPEYREGALQVPRNSEVEVAILARGYQPQQITLFMKEPRDITVKLVKKR